MKTGLLAVYLAAAYLVGASSAQEVAAPAPPAARAPAAPIVVDGGRSPDGRKRLVIIDTTDEQNGSGARGDVQIRDTRTGKPLVVFQWQGYGAHPQADSITVLWRPDSRAFAITSVHTKGYKECKVYLLEAKGRCREVLLPDFVAQVSKKFGYESDFHGGEAPIRWLPNNRLVIEVFNRGFVRELPSGIVEGKIYAVTLRILAAGKSPKADVTDIRPVREMGG